MPLRPPAAQPFSRPSSRPSLRVANHRAGRRTAVVLAAVAGCLAPLAVAAPSSGAVRPATASTVRTALATTYQPSAADRRIATMLSRRATVRLFGRSFSGTVIDAESGRVIWSRYGGTGRMPASTTKLITATNALEVFGPAHRFTTQVRRSADPRTVTIIGAGDPSLSSADLRELARQTAADSKARGLTWVRVRFDDYLFARPSLAAGWKRSYVPADVRWVRALVVDGHHVTDTSRDAAQVFARYLVAEGVRVSSVYRSKVPTGAAVVASVQGDRLDEIVQQMMLVSDNDHAEALHKLVARAVRQRATWTGARVAQRQVLARQGISLPTTAMKDGSGLSRSDRLTSTQLARVVANLLDPNDPNLAVLRTSALPVAARTGTLRASLGRFTSWPGRCAAGQVAAKTGSLADAVTLAGYTRGTDGRLKSFAFVVNYKRADHTLRRHIDGLAATVTGCY